MLALRLSSTWVMLQVPLPLALFIVFSTIVLLKSFLKLDKPRPNCQTSPLRWSQPQSHELNFAIWTRLSCLNEAIVISTYWIHVNSVSIFAAFDVEISFSQGKKWKNDNLITNHKVNPAYVQVRRKNYATAENTKFSKDSNVAKENAHNENNCFRIQQ